MKYRTFLATIASIVAIGSFGLVAAQGNHVHDMSTPSAGMGEMSADATPEGDMAGMSMGAFYFTVNNSGDEADTLVRIESDVAMTIEIHDVKMSGGVMAMVPQLDGVEVPANGELVLKPGSFHVMLIGLNMSLMDGEEFTATLVFEHAGEVEVTVPIFATEPEASDLAETVTVGDNLEVSGIWARQAPKIDGMATPMASPMATPDN